MGQVCFELNLRRGILSALGIRAGTGIQVWFGQAELKAKLECAGIMLVMLTSGKN